MSSCNALTLLALHSLLLFHPIFELILSTSNIKLASLSALQLMRDGQQIPWTVRQIVKRAFYEEVPVSGSQGAFNVNPISNTAVRARLLDMAYNDDLRKDSAYELIGKIDKWRLESGKPDFEPRHPNISSGISWSIVETEIGENFV